MTLDARGLTSSLVAELAREFPWATPQQLAQAAEDSLSVFADARVQAFLPILAGREARRALKTSAPGLDAIVRQPLVPRPDLTAEAVGSHG